MIEISSRPLGSHLFAIPYVIHLIIAMAQWQIFLGLVVGGSHVSRLVVFNHWSFVSLIVVGWENILVS